MKQSVNFRLCEQAIVVLSLIEKKTHKSKTAIVEDALQFYAEKKLIKENPLLAYAGILNEKEAEKIISSIKSSRHNKELKGDL